MGRKIGAKHDFIYRKCQLGVLDYVHEKRIQYFNVIIVVNSDPAIALKSILRHTCSCRADEHSLR
jgi:hypothetical protein